MDADAIKDLVDRMVREKLDEAKAAAEPSRGSKVSAFSGQKLTDRNVSKD